MIWLACGAGAIALALIVHSWLEERAYKRWVAEHRLYRRDAEITAYLQMHER
jgi:heme exporter protein D